MTLDQEEEKKRVHPVNSRDGPSEVKESMEKEEPSIDLLQWYLKMIIDSEEGPKIKK